MILSWTSGITRVAPIVAVVLWAAVLVMPSRALAGEVTVFAAASLKNVLEDIADRWESETGNQVVLSFGGSSALARQIQHGAPAYIFISANVAWMDALEEDGLINAPSRFDLTGNRLVLIAHERSPQGGEIGPDFDLAGLLGQGRLAMALINAVPAGIYGKEALQSLDLWEEAASRVAQTDNVRAALALVASGEAPAGIVYATDAVAETRVTVAGTFPEQSHTAIRYPVAGIAGRDNPTASAFLAFLGSRDAQTALADHGFVTLPSNRRGVEGQ